MNRTEALKAMLEGKEVRPLIYIGRTITRCWYDEFAVMPFRIEYEPGEIEDLEWNFYYCDWKII